MKDPNYKKAPKNTNPHKRLPPFFGLNLRNIRQEDEKGRLYYFNYKGNYYRLEKYLNLLGLPACSTFFTKSKEKGEYIFGRNYDQMHNSFNKDKGWNAATGLPVVIRCTNPKAKYASLGTLDGFWFDIKKGEMFEKVLSDGKTDITAFALAPFAIMDGLNEAGLALSIMHLPTENEWTEIPYREESSLTEEENAHKRILTKAGEVPDRYDTTIKSGCITINTVDKKTWKVNKNFAINQNDPHKEKIVIPALLRHLLDFAKNVDEAVEIAKSYNVVSPMRDNDYHIFAADKTGHSVILEWINNVFYVTPTNHSTNYAFARKDRYGYGYDRDDVLVEHLSKHSDGMNEREATDTLFAAAQDARVDKFTSISQWSLLYFLNKGEMKIRTFMNFDKVYTYKIK